LVAETPWSLRIYATVDGRRPFAEWLGSLKDQRGRRAIKSRLDRVELGNFGDCRSLGGGLNELRVHFGPGYRVYYGQEGQRIVLLLCGGDKTTQDKDIAKARAYWQDYWSRSDA